MGTPLTTGWEPDLAPADSLLRRFVLGYADRTADMAQRVGGRAERDADAALADLASPFGYDNAVVLLRPPTEAGLAGVLDRAAAFYPAGRAWVLLSAWSLPDLSGRGLGLVGHPPLMLRPDGRASPQRYPAELRIQPVTTAADLAVFGRVLVDGFPLDGEPGVITDPRLLGGSLHLFVGYAGSAPVAVSGAYLHHGLVEVDWVVTLPVARRRGYGRALTWRALQIAPDAPAMLLASDPGRPVYERMGFLPLLRMTMWAREPKVD
jgi:GNAT superfamily N-acetyltransferase